MKYFTFLLILFLFQTGFSAPSNYKLDWSHSRVGFEVSHLMFSKVIGRFDRYEGSFRYDLKSKVIENVDIKINVDSINTNEAKRDNHLKSPDFFGVK